MTGPGVGGSASASASAAASAAAAAAAASAATASAAAAAAAAANWDVEVAGSIPVSGESGGNLGYSAPRTSAAAADSDCLPIDDGVLKSRALFTSVAAASDCFPQDSGDFEFLRSDLSDLSASFSCASEKSQMHTKPLTSIHEGLV